MSRASPISPSPCRASAPASSRSSARRSRRRSAARRCATARRSPPFALSEPDAGSDVAAMATQPPGRLTAAGGSTAQDLDLERRHRRPLCRLRPHRRGAGRPRHLRLHRARRCARPRHRRAHRRHRAASARDPRLRRLPPARRRADRQGRRRLRHGHGQSRHLPPTVAAAALGMGYRALDEATRRAKSRIMFARRSPTSS